MLVDNIKPTLAVFDNCQAPEGFILDFTTFCTSDTSVVLDILREFSPNFTTRFESDIITEISEEHGISKAQVRAILSVTSFIFSQLSTGKLTFENLKKDMDTLHLGKYFDDIKKLYHNEFSTEFTKRSDSYELAKAEVHSVLPSFTAIEWNLNLRAVSNSKDEVINLVPITNISIITQVKKPMIDDYNEFIFQLTPQQVDIMITTLTRISKQLKNIQKYNDFENHD